MPVVFSGEYIHNHRAFNNQDTGWAAGVAFGEASGNSGRKVFYQYQDIEREAVFSPFVNDDFPYATNYSGHVVGVDQKLCKATILRLWALHSERNVAGAAFPDSS